MRLELLVEEQTPKATVESLVGGLQELIPLITAVGVRGYEFRGENVYDVEDVRSAVGQEIIEMGRDANWQESGGSVILLRDVDAMRIPQSGIDLNPGVYCNAAQLLAQPIRGGELRLAGADSRWFVYVATLDSVVWRDSKTGELVEEKRGITPRLFASGGQHEDASVGVWIYRSKGGIVSLSKDTRWFNVQIAAHELGHGLGLKHHYGCIMRFDAGYTEEKLREFCTPCKDVVSGVVGK